MEQLTNFFLDKAVENILDVGTGTGDFVNVLTEIFSEADITGIDPDTKSLTEAAKSFPAVNFQKMGAEKLLFKANSFDVVSMSMALHHLPKVQKSLKEIKRVVRPEGWIIISELVSDHLNPAQEVHKMFHHFRSRIDRLLGIHHKEAFQKEQILQMIRGAGITIQFYFDFNQNINLIEKEGELELRIEKMKQALERINGTHEYDLLKPQIEDFREKAQMHGFQPATRLVIVGKKR